jgi:hypothetical protein
MLAFMNKSLLFSVLALTATLAAGATPAISASPARETLATASLGKGTVSAWKEGNVLGASIDAAALASLPAQPAIVDLPLSGVAPFQLVEIDWNPKGHEPAGIYDVPHFDVHFYVISKQQRDAIPFAKPGTVSKPSAAIVPDGFVTDTTVVPKMGMHFVPKNAPEFNGKAFTCTPLYGYTDRQQFAFVEAMFTQKFIAAKESCAHVLPSPKGLMQAAAYKSIRVAPNENTGGYDIKLAD